MEVLYKRCCGIDIHKNMMVACVFTSVRKKEIRHFSTMTEDILQLAVSYTHLTLPTKLEV